jgi:hypothetical protein
MRVAVLYREQTDYARTVIDFLRDFKHQTGHDLEVLDPDSPEGVHFAETYDITDYPTIIATTDDGVMQNIWTSLPLPTISEVSFYCQ